MPAPVFRSVSAGWSGYCLKSANRCSGNAGNWLAVNPFAVTVTVRVAGSPDDSAKGSPDHSSAIFTLFAGNQCCAWYEAGAGFISSRTGLDCLMRVLGLGPKGS